MGTAEIGPARNMLSSFSVPKLRRLQRFWLMLVKSIYITRYLRLMLGCTPEGYHVLDEHIGHGTFDVSSYCCTGILCRLP